MTIDQSNPRKQMTERDAAIRIIHTLRNGGYTAYLAGGCVRDLLFGEDPKDYDVATDAHPEDIGKLFKKTAAVGAAFGVMLVRDFGCTIEVATFRSDGPYTDARRPDHVEFSSPELDAQRRDFTINALFLNPTESGDEIIDFVNGRADIETKVLRAVGNPDDRLKEDHLRALRAVRFAARYGLTIDPKTSDAIRSHASELSGVSIERIGDEVRRMMAHPSRSLAADLIQQLTLDTSIFGVPAQSASLKTLASLEEGASAMTALGAWAIDRMGDSVLSREGAIHMRWSGKLDLSNSQSEELNSNLEIAGLLLNDWSSMTIAQRKRLASRQHCCGAIMLTRAIKPELAQRVCTDIESMSNDGVGLNPEPLITGQDLIDLGETPGRAFKEILDEIYDSQLEGGVKSTDSARNLAKELFVKYNKSDQ